MVIAFTAMVLSYFISVVNRNIIKGSMPWTEEVAMYSMIFMALLGTEIGLRDGTQVAVTAVIDKLHGTTKKVVSLVKQVVVVIFAFMMTSGGYALTSKQLKLGQTTPVLKIPMGLMYSSLVLAFGLIFIIQTITLIHEILMFNKNEEDTAV